MKISYYLAFAAAAIACNANHVAEPAGYSYPVTQVREDQFAFKTVLDTGDYKIKVIGIDHPTAQELVVHISGGNKLLSEIRRTVTGRLSTAFTGDLNADGQPELYVLSRESADSTALMAFSIAGDSLTEIALPAKKTGSRSAFEITTDHIIETITNKNGDTEKWILSLSPQGNVIRKIA
ncbi:MAG: hypothetical protein V4616_13405 [Bacteroidota bacterium]